MRCHWASAAMRMAMLAGIGPCPRSMAGSVLVASRSPASSLTWIWAQAGTQGGVTVWPVTGSMVVAPLR